MKGKRIIALLAVVGLAATAIVATVTVQAGHDRSEACYDPAGTWIWTFDHAVAIIFNITPCDPARNKLTIAGDILSDRSWLYDYFGVGPVFRYTTSWGTMVRTARNTYETTLVHYGVDAAFNIVYWDVSSGTVVQTGPDTFEYSGTSSFYTGDQDPLSGEPPGIGCFPETLVARRVPILPPCQP